MPVAELSPDQLRRVCDPAIFSFRTTAELPEKTSIIGQPRGTRAIEFGIDIDSPGYNIYVLGQAGTGRATAIQRFLQERAAIEPVPQDWWYVNNFAEPHKPRALNLPAGLGTKLRDAMPAVVDHLRREIPKAFERAEYQEAHEQIQRTFEAERDRTFEDLQSRAGAANFGILRSPAGLTVVPLAPSDGQPVTPDTFESLPPDQKEALDNARRDIEHELEGARRAVREVEKAAKERVQNLDRQVAASVVGRTLGELKEQYAAFEETVFYLGEVENDLIVNAADFRPDESAPATPDPSIFRRYTANLIVDHGKMQGAPVVVEFNPTYSNLMGRVEHEVRLGALVTDFTMIRAGALHVANGGYLVVRARDLLAEPLTWDALKRSLVTGRIDSEDLSARGGTAVTQSLDPEPIPLDLKVVLIGPPSLYYWLHNRALRFSPASRPARGVRTASIRKGRSTSRD